MTLLRADESCIVRDKRTGEEEKAIPGTRGALRDSEGRGYSDGAYEIVEVLE